jgi:hypothetical protein
MRRERLGFGAGAISYWLLAGQKLPIGDIAAVNRELEALPRSEDV